jgi:hypothetical protein
MEVVVVLRGYVLVFRGPVADAVERDVVGGRRYTALKPIDSGSIRFDSSRIVTSRLVSKVARQRYSEYPNQHVVVEVE